MFLKFLSGSKKDKGPMGIQNNEGRSFFYVSFYVNYVVQKFF